MNESVFYVLVNGLWWISDFSNLAIDVSDQPQNRLRLTQGEAEILCHQLENDPAMFAQIVREEVAA